MSHQQTHPKDGSMLLSRLYDDPIRNSRVSNTSIMGRVSFLLASSLLITYLRDMFGVEVSILQALGIFVLVCAQTVVSGEFLLIMIGLSTELFMKSRMFLRFVPFFGQQAGGPFWGTVLSYMEYKLPLNTICQTINAMKEEYPPAAESGSYLVALAMKKYCCPGLLRLLFECGATKGAGVSVPNEACILVHACCLDCSYNASNILFELGYTLDGTDQPRRLVHALVTGCLKGAQALMDEYPDMNCRLYQFPRIHLGNLHGVFPGQSPSAMGWMTFCLRNFKDPYAIGDLWLLAVGLDTATVSNFLSQKQIVPSREAWTIWFDEAARGEPSDVYWHLLVQSTTKGAFRDSLEAALFGWERPEAEVNAVLLGIRRCIPALALNYVLVHAVASGKDAQYLQTLVDEGADVNCIFEHSGEMVTPLFVAAPQPYVDFDGFSWFLMNGADPDFEFRDMNALTFSFLFDHKFRKSRVYQLLEMGASPNSKWPILHNAARNRDENTHDLARLIMDRYPHVAYATCVFDGEKRNVLESCIAFEYSPLMRELVSNRNVLATAESQSRALRFAVVKQKYTSVQYLLEECGAAPFCLFEGLEESAMSIACATEESLDTLYSAIRYSSCLW